VKVLRTGGGYLAEQAERYETRHLRILVIGAVVAIMVALALHPALGVIPVLIAASRARPVSRKLRRVQHGAQGEEEVTQLLSRLPDDYILVNDVALPRGLGNVDHVVLGPCGIVVIETKRYQGHIVCRHGQWFQDGRPLPRSIGRQANGGAAAIKRFLREEHPQLAATALRWVHGLVVFTHPLCSLEVDRPDVTTVRYSELLDAIRATGTGDALAPSVARMLAHTLVRAARVRDRCA